MRTIKTYEIKKTERPDGRSTPTFNVTQFGKYVNVRRSGSG